MLEQITSNDFEPDEHLTISEIITDKLEGVDLNFSTWYIVVEREGA